MPIFCSMSDSDIGKTLPFAQTTTRRLARRLDRVQHGRQQLRRGRRAELVVDDHGDLDAAPASSSEKRGPETGDSSAARAAAVASGTGARLVGVDGREQVRVGDLELERVPVDLVSSPEAPIVSGSSDS